VTSIDTCRLCAAVAIRDRSVFDTVLVDSPRFVVMPTLGQFLEGWLMVVSKSHTRCVRDHGHETLAELDYILTRCQVLLENAYGPTVVFEHGPGPSRYTQAGCCVEHTHVHIAPLPSPERFLRHIPFKMVPLDSLGDLQRRSSRLGGYLLIGKGLLGAPYWACSVTEPIPRQFLRQVLAACCGREDAWDWRLHSFDENARSSVERLLPLIDASWLESIEDGLMTREVSNV